MAVQIEREQRQIEGGLAPLPLRQTFRGPLTTARLQRSATVLFGVWAVGGCIALLADTAALRAVGVGLLMPGAGLLVGGHWVAFAATSVCFALAFAWFWLGAAIAPVAVWSAALVLGAAVAGPEWPAVHWIVPAIIGVAAATATALRLLSARASARRHGERAAFLDVRRLELAARPAPERSYRELSEDDLAHMRSALDRGLQPLDEFAGLGGVGPDERLQLGVSAARYQLCQSGWTLAHIQHTFTPSFRGYLDEAQHNFIEKMLDPKVWTYWEDEEVWGHFKRHQADPVVRDNIMYSGYFAYLLTGYLSNTGDRGYDPPGSLTFAHPDGRRYEYDVHRLLEALMHNFRSSPYCLFACEPGWAYTKCNGYAALALPIYDRLYGTDLCGDILPEFLARFEDEFVTRDGRLPMAVSSRTGLSMFRPSLMFDAMAAWQLAPIDAGIARRTYEILREYQVDFTPGTPVRLKRNLFPDRMDLGNYRQHSGFTYATLLAAAAEMGDTELADQLVRDIDDRFPATRHNGAKSYTTLSVWSEMFVLKGRLTREGDHVDRVRNGTPEHIRNGPILAQVAYPEVLVARATTDGNDLDLVLYPGDATRDVRIRVARLRPHSTYTIQQTGATFIADHQGEAIIALTLNDRTPLHITPQL